MCPDSFLYYKSDCLCVCASRCLSMHPDVLLSVSICVVRWTDVRMSRCFTLLKTQHLITKTYFTCSQHFLVIIFQTFFPLSALTDMKLLFFLLISSCFIQNCFSIKVPIQNYEETEQFFKTRCGKYYFFNDYKIDWI